MVTFYCYLIKYGPSFVSDENGGTIFGVNSVKTEGMQTAILPVS
jgi:hypothetical protein